jgi:hypothetical protein
MALWFDLRANGDVIGTFVAIRRDSLIPADRICTYDVEFSIHGRRSSRVVRHNHDAGAIALLAAALTDYTREVS